LFVSFFDAALQTLVDLHQDLLSKYFCGEGAPDFLVPIQRGLTSFPVPVALPYALNHSTGYPVSCPKSFGLYYPTFAVAEAFQALYENANGFADAFVYYWETVGKRFANNSNVVGLELINEPFIGNFFKFPKLLESGVTDVRYLFPLYTRAVNAIRSTNSRHIIFFEPMVADAGLSGFANPPDSNSVYSYHVYCAGQPSKV
jgi:endoglycosylceramidase